MYGSGRGPTMSVSHAVRVVPCDRTEVNVGDELVIAEFSWFSDLKSAARWGRPRLLAESQPSYPANSSYPLFKALT